MAAKKSATGDMPDRSQNPKMDTGTIAETEFIPLLKSFGCVIPEEITLPFSYKLTDKHALVVERRDSFLVSDEGLVSQLNWRVHENMVNRVGRE